MRANKPLKITCELVERCGDHELSTPRYLVSWRHFRPTAHSLGSMYVWYIDASRISRCDDASTMLRTSRQKGDGTRDCPSARPKTAIAFPQQPKLPVVKRSLVGSQGLLLDRRSIPPLLGAP